jgi:hypothetical protein
MVKNLTQDIKEVFSSKPHVRVLEALMLEHPKFSKPYNLINDGYDHVLYPPNSQDTVKFIGLPFSVQLPQVGETQQDVNIILPNIDFTLQEELDSAIQDSNTPIQVTYILYLEDNDLPQAYFGNLEFTSIAADEKAITAKATRKDLFQYFILEDRYDFRFEGLWL